MKNLKIVELPKVLMTTLFKFFGLSILAVPYSEFLNDNVLTLDETNRKTNKDHIKKMGLSLKIFGLLRCLVVMLDEKIGKYVVLDGQHLLEAARINKTAVLYCIVYAGKEKSKAMRTLNNTQKPWNLLQYIKQGAKEGKKDYILLLENLNGFIKSSVLPMIFSLKSREETRKDIKNGAFKVLNPRAKDTIKYIIECYDCNQTLPNTRQYHEALAIIMLKTKEFNILKFTKNLSRVKIVNLGNDEQGIQNQLRAIYENKKVLATI